ncbi:MAG: nucleotidyl transferase AbiEii/AbiGii toxin family protein [Chlamydiae bacterium]|nr:nucleotidyl transferase AbiEii/AbiGii toxin family protein [Chlamydiota bacterium]
MIPRSHIQEWSKNAPWQEPRQIEQDLIITNALLKLYSHPYLRISLAFRGGTALNKLFFNPPTRYSEDIDLVQTTAEPIGQTLDSIRSVLDTWLGEPKRGFANGRISLIYCVLSDEGFPLKLKIEINSREHFSVLGFQDYPLTCNSSWSAGTVMIRTFKIEELLGTKMRALYQRRKGRDLYDLYIAFRTFPGLDRQAILQCFSKYLAFGGHCISKKLFLENMSLKLQNKEFREDMIPLLPRQKEPFVAEIAYQHVRENLLEYL